MKSKFTFLATGAVSAALSLLLFQQTASADIQQQAGNGCFPRVFSQIDQFKMSSGGLRNTSANPRSIVCSINNDNLSEVNTGISSAYIHVETLPADMECLLVARNTSTGALIDSEITIISAGNNGSQNVGNLVWSDGATLFFSDHSVYKYLQCKVPGNGRVFSYNTYYAVAP